MPSCQTPKKKLRIVTGVCAVALGASCGDGNDAPLDAAIEAAATSSIELNAEYLEGAWCYSHYSTGDQRHEQNLNYVFATDGTLQAQNSAGASGMRPGTWHIEDGDLKLVQFSALPLKIGRVEPELFVFIGMGEHFFSRGRCSED